MHGFSTSLMRMLSEFTILLSHSTLNPKSQKLNALNVGMNNMAGFLVIGVIMRGIITLMFEPNKGEK